MVKFFELYFYTIGIFTTVYLATIMLTVCVVRIVKAMRDQKKIKWLCHHEYEAMWVHEYTTAGYKFVFICRKCGKRHVVETCNHNKFHGILSHYIETEEEYE